MIGPVQAAVLTELAASPGTAAEVAGRLGRPDVAVQQAIARLARNRCAEMLHRRPGSVAGVWCATAKGRRVLGLPPSLPEPPPADPAPAREGECGRCGYLKTARGHHAACGEAT
jgi:hypothetical protein